MKNIIFICISFVACYCLLLPYCKAQCNLDDWVALKAIYESLGGENWRNQDGWDQVKVTAPTESCNLSNLNGIVLNTIGRVAELNFKTIFLKGSIPPEIGDLTYLTFIDFNYNRL